jgi:hypothetical protein
MRWDQKLTCVDVRLCAIMCDYVRLCATIECLFSQALEFAKNIPKPIVRRKEESATEERSPSAERERNVHPSELERLQAEHDALAVSIQKIRQEFSGIE